MALGTEDLASAQKCTSGLASHDVSLGMWYTYLGFEDLMTLVGL